jgi:hypothetical protein
VCTCIHCRASPSGSNSEQIASHTDFHHAAPRHAEVGSVQPDFATDSHDFSFSQNRE